MSKPDVEEYIVLGCSGIGCVFAIGFALIPITLVIYIISHW